MHKNADNAVIDRAVALHKMMRLSTLAAAKHGYLNFMGNEIAQIIEWRDDREIDWLLLQYPKHNDFQRFIADLNKIYLKKFDFL